MLLGEKKKAQRPILSIQGQCCNNEVNLQRALIRDPLFDNGRTQFKLALGQNNFLVVFFFFLAHMACEVQIPGLG